MIIDHLLDPLTASARATIDADYWTYPAAALRRAMREPEFVATLVGTFVGPLAQAWEEVLDGTGVDLTVHGAFLHQRPKVRFPRTVTGVSGYGNCEIADLLIVQDHDEKTRQACLVQAKKDLGSSVKGDQKDLYENWPPLRFAAGMGGRSARGPVYDVAPNAEGGWYGIVSVPRLGLGSPWTMRQPTALVPDMDLGAFVASMLVATVAGRTGPARRARIGGGDDWSDLVEALLLESLGSKYPLKDFWPDRVSRAFSTRVIGWVDSRDRPEAMSRRGSAPPPPDGDGVEADSPQGVAVIHITTSGGSD